MAHLARDTTFLSAPGSEFSRRDRKLIDLMIRQRGSEAVRCPGRPSLFLKGRLPDALVAAD